MHRLSSLRLKLFAGLGLTATLITASVFALTPQLRGIFVVSALQNTQIHTPPQPQTASSVSIEPSATVAAVPGTAASLSPQTPEHADVTLMTYDATINNNLPEYTFKLATENITGGTDGFILVTNKISGEVIQKIPLGDYHDVSKDCVDMNTGDDYNFDGYLDLFLDDGLCFKYASSQVWIFDTITSKYVINKQLGGYRDVGSIKKTHTLQFSNPTVNGGEYVIKTWSTDGRSLITLRFVEFFYGLSALGKSTTTTHSVIYGDYPSVSSGSWDVTEKDGGTEKSVCKIVFNGDHYCLSSGNLGSCGAVEEVTNGREMGRMNEDNITCN